MSFLHPYTVPCLPPAWARGGHAQTLLGHLLPSPGRRLGTEFQSREVRSEDGDRLHVVCAPGTSGVRVHLFHGLSGDVDSDYMRRTAAALQRHGHGIWAVNHRGCGAGAGLALHPYHSGRSEDLEAVLAASFRDAPDLMHLVIGFSLSGNLALLHAAEGREPRPAGLIAVNPPVDIEGTTVRLGLGWSRLYERRFIWRLRRAVRVRERAHRDVARTSIPFWSSMLEFDDLFTAPQCGFRDGLDYYRLCSTHTRLGEVATPAVILTAKDDPFVDPRMIERAEPARHVHIHMEDSGGHMGYLCRAGRFGFRHWLDGALVHYVNELARNAGVTEAV